MFVFPDPDIVEVEDDSSGFADILASFGVKLSRKPAAIEGETPPWDENFKWHEQFEQLTS
jgi:hypothetical protein